MRMPILVRAAVGTVAASALILSTPTVVLAAPDDDPPPVTLDAPLADPRDAQDDSGQKVRIYSHEDEPAEKSAAALTDDGDPVLIRSFFGEDPDTAVLEPVDGLPDEWIEDVNYATDDEPQVETETFSFDELPQGDPADLELELTTATGTTTFSAAWNNNEGVEYEIYRDDVLLETTTENSFTDTTLTPDSEYVYSATPVDTIDTEEPGMEHTFNVTTLPANAASVIKNDSDAISTMAVPKNASWFMYHTFITNKYVGWDIFQTAGLCGSGPGDYFGGDNRGYKTPPLFSDPWDATPMRTGARVKIDWIGSGKVITNKLVSPTRLYDNNHKLIDTRTAKANGIVFQNPTIHGTKYLSLGISHEVGNPFCKLGAIRYSLPSVQIWKNGTMSISGSRQPVPAHEAYGLFTNSNGSQAWVTMYRGKQGDFFCLSGACPSQKIKKSHTPS